MTYVQDDIKLRQVAKQPLCTSCSDDKTLFQFFNVSYASENALDMVMLRKLIVPLALPPTPYLLPGFSTYSDEWEDESNFQCY